MAMTAEEIVREEIEVFKNGISIIRTEHSRLIPELTTEIDAAGYDSVSDYFQKAIDACIGVVQERAVNRIDNELEQDQAMTSIETWFSDNVSHLGTEYVIATAIWGYGPEMAAEHIRSELANANELKI